MSIPKVLAPSVPNRFKRRLKAFDKYLEVVFNCQTERWELYRISKGKIHWVMAIENEDTSYRPLDERVFKQLYVNDILNRFGSIANYERHMDEKQKKWQQDRQKEMDYELSCDIKNDRKLWQRAAENVRSGIINTPPEEKGKKVFSYPKGG